MDADGWVLNGDLVVETFSRFEEAREPPGKRETSYAIVPDRPYSNLLVFRRILAAAHRSIDWLDDYGGPTTLDTIAEAESKERLGDARRRGNYARRRGRAC